REPSTHAEITASATTSRAWTRTVRPDPLRPPAGWPGGASFPTMPGEGRRQGERRRFMLFYCGYTWFPNTRPEEVWERVVHQHERGSNAPELIRGWYDFAGGGAGFLIVETDDVRELTAMLRPYIDLMAW